MRKPGGFSYPPVEQMSLPLGQAQRNREVGMNPLSIKYRNYSPLDPTRCPLSGRDGPRMLLECFPMRMMEWYLWPKC